MHVRDSWISRNADQIHHTKVWFQMEIRGKIVHRQTFIFTEFQFF